MQIQCVKLIVNEISHQELVLVQPDPSRAWGCQWEDRFGSGSCVYNPWLMLRVPGYRSRSSLLLFFFVKIKFVNPRASFFQFEWNILVSEYFGIFFWSCIVYVCVYIYIYIYIIKYINSKKFSSNSKINYLELYNLILKKHNKIIFINKIMSMYNIKRMSSSISQGRYILWLLWNFNIIYIYKYIKRLLAKFHHNLIVGLRDIIDIIKFFII